MFRYQNFGTNLPYLLMSPLPLNIYGYESLQSLLSGGKIDLSSVVFIKSFKVRI